MSNNSKNVSVGQISAVKPPHSITEAGNTSSLSDDLLSIVPDWFSLTFQKSSLTLATLETELQRQFPTATPEPMPSGRYGYRRGSKIGAAFLYWDGHRQDMGFHVQFSGEAIRSARDIFDFCCWSVEQEAKASRFDIACDDKTGKYLDIDRMTATAQATGQLGAFQKHRVFSEQASTGALTGNCIYFGSRTANVFARAYDKRLDMLRKVKEGEELPTIWNRLEFELKNEQANAAFQRFVTEGQSCLPSLFGFYADRYLSFRVPSSDDSNRSRWAVASWWQSFIEQIPRASIVLDKAVSTIHKKAAWFAKSVKKTVALLLESPDYGAEWLKFQIQRGLHSMTEQDRAMAMDTPF